MCRFINNANKTIDANNISNICRNISHKIYVQIVNVERRQDLEHGDLQECMWFELETKFQSILININYRSVALTIENKRLEQEVLMK
jgi:hypothetical protein